jgi:hypothetical protein
MIINIRNFSITLCLLVVAAIFSVPPVTAAVCGDESTTYNLTIRIVQDRPAEVLHRGKNADEFHVCPGDSIEWKLQGSEKSFYLDFLAGAPFSGDHRPNSHSGKILVSIDNGSSGDIFDYNIGLNDGEEMDPRIIID